MDNNSGFFDESVFIVHALLSSLLYFAYKECQKVLKNLEKLPQYEVGKQLTAALDLAGKEALSYVAVRGRVQAIGQPIKTSHGTPAVVQLLLSIDHYRNRLFSGSWGSSENLVSSSSLFVPFGLRDPSRLFSSPLLIIDEPATADIRNILITVGSVFEKKAEPPNISSYFFSSLAGTSQIGTETTEKILPVGAMMTAIGKVTKFPDGTIHMSHPHDASGTLPYILTTLGIEDVKSGYKLQLRAYGVGGAVLTAVATFFAMKILYKWTSCFYIKRLRQNIVKNRNPNGIEGLHESQICITCLTNPREVLFIPCGHIVVCVDCLEKLRDQRCPVCRDYILYSYPAFIP